MRIVYFGSGDFAVPGLVALVSSGFEVVTVVTQPDKRAGRGGNIKGTPVKAVAEELGIPVYQPVNLKTDEALKALSQLQPELSVVTAYGHKIPPEMLSVPPLGFVNAHASLLPKYRGAAPVPHAILNGEDETGVTIFKLVEEWDSGPVYGYVHTPIRKTDTSLTVLERLAAMSGEILVKIVSQIKNNSIESIPQNDGEATRAPKFKREDGRIDWSESWEAIDRKVRAFQPWPPAFTLFPGKRGKLQQVNILGVEHEHVQTDDTPGTVILADDKIGIVIAVGGKQALRLTSIKPEGKKVMTGAEFMRGSRLTVGTVLGQ
jgi:methionyl-tRNA formyltransferase